MSSAAACSGGDGAGNLALASEGGSGAEGMITDGGGNPSGGEAAAAAAAGGTAGRRGFEDGRMSLSVISPVKCVKNEIHNILTVLRLTKQYISADRFYHEVARTAENPIVASFKHLFDSLTYVNEFHIDVSHLNPFLEVIASPDTNGPITAVALAAVNKFVAYGLIDARIPAAATATNAITEGVLNCRFQASGTPADEVVLLKILNVLTDTLRCPAGEFLTNENVWRIVRKCYQISRQPRASYLLRSSAENFLSQVILTLFGCHKTRTSQGDKLQHFKNASQHEHLKPYGVGAMHKTLRFLAFLTFYGYKKKKPSQSSKVHKSHHHLAVVSRHHIQHAASATTSTASTATAPAHSLNGRTPEPAGHHRNPSAATGVAVDGSTAFHRSTSTPGIAAAAADSTASLGTVSNSDASSVAGPEFGCLTAGQIDQSADIEEELALPFLSSSPEEEGEEFCQEMRSLGLTLLNVALETGGEELARYPSLIAVIQDEICKSLLQNARTQSLFLLSVTLRCVINLFIYFKKHLKLQLEIFFNSIHLRIAGGPDFGGIAFSEKRELAMESILEFCREPDLMVELYENYDCDVHCTNLFEALGRFLTLHSRTDAAAAALSGTSPSSTSMAAGAAAKGAIEKQTATASAAARLRQSSPQAFNILHRLALSGLLSIIHGIASRCNFEGAPPPPARNLASAVARASVTSPVASSVRPSTGAVQSKDVGASTPQSSVTARFSDPGTTARRRSAGGADSQHSKAGGSSAMPAASTSHGPGSPRATPSRGGEAVDSASRGRNLKQRKEMKERLTLAAQVFNSEPSKCIPPLQKLGMLPFPCTADAMAKFLRTNPGLDKRVVGEYLAKPKEWNHDVREAFLSTFCFSGVSLVEALRSLLATFRLPGESQQIERLMESFSSHFFDDQPSVLQGRKPEAAPTPDISKPNLIDADNKSKDDDSTRRPESDDVDGGAARPGESDAEPPRKPEIDDASKPQVDDASKPEGDGAEEPSPPPSNPSDTLAEFLKIPRWTCSESLYWQMLREGVPLGTREEDRRDAEGGTMDGAAVADGADRRDVHGTTTTGGAEVEAEEMKAHVGLPSVRSWKRRGRDSPPQGCVVLENSDTIFVLSYSIIMLQTDLHNAQVKNKMKIEEFIRNNRQINNGKDLPPQYITDIYESIREEPISLLDDAHQGGVVGFGAQSDDAFWNQVLRKQQELDAYSTFSPVQRAGVHERDMFFVLWDAGCLESICSAFQSTQDVTVMQQCITGFWELAKIATYYGLPQPLNTLIRTLVTHYVNFWMTARSQMVIPIVLQSISHCANLFRLEAWNAVMEVLLEFLALDLLPPSMAQLDDFTDVQGRALRRVCVLSPPSIKIRKPIDTQASAQKTSGWFSDLAAALFSAADSSDDDDEEFVVLSRQTAASAVHHPATVLVHTQGKASVPGQSHHTSLYLFDPRGSLPEGDTSMIHHSESSPIFPVSGNTPSPLADNQQQPSLEKRPSKTSLPHQPSSGSQSTSGKNQAPPPPPNPAASNPFTLLKTALTHHFRLEEVITKKLRHLPAAAYLPLANHLIRMALPRNLCDSLLRVVSAIPPPAAPSSASVPVPPPPAAPQTSSNPAAPPSGGAATRQKNPSAQSNVVVRHPPARRPSAELVADERAMAQALTALLDQQIVRRYPPAFDFDAIAKPDLQGISEFRKTADAIFSLELLTNLVCIHVSAEASLAEEQRRALASGAPIVADASSPRMMSGASSTALLAGRSNSVDHFVSGRGASVDAGETGRTSRPSNLEASAGTAFGSWPSTAIVNGSGLPASPALEYLWKQSVTYFDAMLRRYVIAGAAENLPSPEETNLFAARCAAALSLSESRRPSAAASDLPPQAVSASANATAEPPRHRKLSAADPTDAPLPSSTSKIPSSLANASSAAKSSGGVGTDSAPASQTTSSTSGNGTAAAAVTRALLLRAKALPCSALDSSELMFVERLVVNTLQLCIRLNHVEDPRVSPVLLGLLQLLAHLHPNPYRLQAERILSALQLLINQAATTATPSPFCTPTLPHAANVLLALFQRCSPISLPPFQTSNPLSSSLTVAPGPLAVQALETMALWLSSPGALQLLSHPARLPTLIQTLLLFIISDRDPNRPPSPDSSDSSGSIPQPTAAERGTAGRSAGFGRTDGVAVGVGPSIAQPEVMNDPPLGAFNLLLSLFSAFTRAAASPSASPAPANVAAKERTGNTNDDDNDDDDDDEDEEEADSTKPQISAEVDWRLWWATIAHALSIVCAFGPRSLKGASLMALQNFVNGTHTSPLSVSNSTAPSEVVTRMQSIDAKEANGGGQKGSSPAVEAAEPPDVAPMPLTDDLQVPIVENTALWKTVVDLTLFPLLTYDFFYPFPLLDALTSSGVTSLVSGSLSTTDDSAPPAPPPSAGGGRASCTVPRIWMGDRLRQRLTLKAAIDSLGAEEVIRRKTTCIGFVTRAILSRIEYLVKLEGDSKRALERDFCHIIPLISKALTLLVVEAQVVPLAHREKYSESIKNVLLVVSSTLVAVDEDVAVRLFPPQPPTAYPPPPAYPSSSTPGQTVTSPPTLKGSSVADLPAPVDLARLRPTDKGLIRLAERVVFPIFPHIVKDVVALLEVAQQPPPPPAQPPASEVNESLSTDKRPSQPPPPPIDAAVSGDAADAENARSSEVKVDEGVVPPSDRDDRLTKRSAEEVGEQVNLWLDMVHDRVKKMWTESELRDLLAQVAEGVSKDDDPVEGPGSGCILWRGKAGSDGSPILESEREKGLSVTRALAFMFADDESFAELQQSSAPVFQMACREANCVQVGHIALPEA